MSRAELRATTPPWYRWWLHAALIAAFSTTMFACALRQLEAPGPVDAGVFAAMLLFANLGEFAIHRRSLHVRHFPYAPYERHKAHHAFFTYDDMAVDELRDMRWVMFPPWALPMMLAAALPFFALLRWTAPPNVAWLFLAAISLYYGIYEVFHSLAHLPAGHPLAGLAFVRAVTHHHRVHHDPRLMRRYNFNFALPLFDWLFGTLYRPPAQAATRFEKGVTPGA
jgi:hypothetical protein